MSYWVTEKLNKVYDLLRDREISIISAISEEMKCVICRSLLVNARQGVCGCNYCECCISEVQMRGISSCYGHRPECAEYDLSDISIDHKMNLRISKLIAKCPESRCTYECELIDMGEHINNCTKDYVLCPFNKVGCKCSHMTYERMREHLKSESFNHNKSLIDAIYELKKDIAQIKADDIKTINDNSKTIESINSEIESVKKNVLELTAIRESVAQLNESGVNIREKISQFELQLQTTLTNLNKHINVIPDGLFSTEIKPGESGSSECFYLKMGSYKMSLNWVQSRQLFRRRTPFSSRDRSFSNVRSSISSGDNRTRTSYRKNEDSRRSENNEIYITLRIYRSTNDVFLKWPFQYTVVVKLNCGGQFKSTTQTCSIERPTKYEYSSSDKFTFDEFHLLSPRTDVIKCTAFFE